MKGIQLKHELLLLKIALGVVSITLVVCTIYALATVSSDTGFLVALLLFGVAFALDRRIETVKARAEITHANEGQSDMDLPESLLKSFLSETGLWASARAIICVLVMGVALAILLANGISIYVGLGVLIVIAILDISWEVWIRIRKRSQGKSTNDEE